LRTPLDQRRRSFVLGSGAIQGVKQRILAQREATGEPLDKHPSTFLAVSSLVWTSIARAKSATPASAAAHYYYLVPVDERFFGNCVAPCFARAAGGDLRAAAAVRANVEAALDGGGVDGWLEAFAAVPEERVTVSSNRFMAYETDFGWGASSWCRCSSGSWSCCWAPRTAACRSRAHGGIHCQFPAGFRTENLVLRPP
jgi:hypothetical protein